MRIGLQIPWFTWPGGTKELSAKLAEIVRAADKNDFSSIWVMDHFFQITAGKAEEPMLDSYTTLPFIAAHTKNAKLGTLVTGANYRHPGLLIKAITTLDVLSGGRAYLGIGAGWFVREALGLGTPFPPVKERMEWLEETLQIAKQMWSGKVAPYEGKHFKLKETLCSPMPLSQPHPPILIGGSGEKKTLKLVAKYANASNIVARNGPAFIKQKLAILRKHCEKVGRLYDDIERTGLDTANLAPNGMSSAEIIQKCQSYADAGLQYIIFNMPNLSDITPLEIFGKEIIPAVSNF